MNRRDALDVAGYLKRLHSDLSTQLGDLPDTARNRSARSRLVKDLDRIATLNGEALKIARRAVEPKKSPDMKVGECPCGQPIMISERYAVAMKGQTTINRKCKARYCGRINAVIVTANLTVQRATYRIIGCLCGADVYTRSDYAGGPRFSGYDTEGSNVFDVWFDDSRDQKNRTVKVDCPECPCKYTLAIRFTKGDDDRVTRSLGDSSKVTRCDGCRRIKAAQNAQDAVTA